MLTSRRGASTSRLAWPVSISTGLSSIVSRCRGSWRPASAPGWLTGSSFAWGPCAAPAASPTAELTAGCCSWGCGAAAAGEAGSPGIVLTASPGLSLFHCGRAGGAGRGCESEMQGAGRGAQEPQPPRSALPRTALAVAVGGAALLHVACRLRLDASGRSRCPQGRAGGSRSRRLRDSPPAPRQRWAPGDAADSVTCAGTTGDVGALN